MAKNKDDEFVTFENSLGETISNDPRWHAKRVLEEAGMSAGVGSTKPADHDDYIPTEYDELDGKALKALAKEREVDITGLKTVGEVRARFVEVDEKAAADAAANEQE